MELCFFFFFSRDLREASSLEELEVKRSEFMVELSQIRQETRVSLNFTSVVIVFVYTYTYCVQERRREAVLSLRSCSLGEDRLGRRYWSLQVSQPHLICVSMYLAT